MYHWMFCKFQVKIALNFERYNTIWKLTWVSRLAYRLNPLHKTLVSSLSLSCGDFVLWTPPWRHHQWFWRHHFLHWKEDARSCVRDSPDWVSHGNRVPRWVPWWWCWVVTFLCCWNMSIVTKLQATLWVHAYMRMRLRVCMPLIHYQAPNHCVRLHQ